MAARLPPMQALRAFEAAARLKSLTRAAEALHLTHGAISHQIKALESDVGVPLVERAGRGIRLTDEGERFAARVRTAFAELTEAMRELTERINPRRLRVSVVPSFAARWLLPRIGRFTAAHPDIDLDVSSSLALVDFARDDVDVAVRYGFGGWTGVVSEPLLGDESFPVCSPRLADGRLPETPADLDRYPLLRAEGEDWKPWFEIAGLDWPEPTRGPSFNDSSHLLQAAAEGHGIAIARRSLLGNDLHCGALVRLFDLTVPSTRKYWLVHPPRLANVPKVRAFLAWMRSEVQAERPLPPARRSIAAASAASRTEPSPRTKRADIGGGQFDRAASKAAPVATDPTATQHSRTKAKAGTTSKAKAVTVSKAKVGPTSNPTARTTKPASANTAPAPDSKTLKARRAVEGSGRGGVPPPAPAAVASDAATDKGARRRR